VVFVWYSAQTSGILGDLSHAWLAGLVTQPQVLLENRTELMGVQVESLQTPIYRLNCREKSSLVPSVTMLPPRSVKYQN
jgi:hypothetical protein